MHTQKRTLPFNYNSSTQRKAKARKVPIDEGKGKYGAYYWLVTCVWSGGVESHKPYINDGKGK